MDLHASLNKRPMHFEKVDGDSLTVPGLSLSVTELVRRQSLGLPLGVGVHGVTDIPEGMTFEAARAEALRHIAKFEAERAAQAQAAAAAAAPSDPGASSAPGSQE